jgi:hypothetical protein
LLTSYKTQDVLLRGGLNGGPLSGSPDTPPSSLMDSTVSPKVKIAEGKGIGVRSLVRNTLGVEGRARAPRWD